MRGLRKVAGDYVEEELAERADGVTGDAVEEFKKLPDGTTAIVFCVTVKHAQDVARSFLNAGFNAKAVYGDMPKDERDAAIQVSGPARSRCWSPARSSARASTFPPWAA